jgi:hypothetical protein
VPSGHVVFALVAAGTVAALVRSRVVRVLAVAYPVFIVAITVATANHFLADAVAAAVVAGVSAGAVRLTRDIGRETVAPWPARSPPARRAS